MNETPKRHITYIILAALMTAFHITSAIRVLSLPQSIAARVSLPPEVQAVLAIAWAGLFAGSVVALFKRRAFALGYTKWLLVSFVVYSVLRLAILARADYDRERLPFLVLVSAILIAVPTIRLLTTLWRRKMQHEGE